MRRVSVELNHNGNRGMPQFISECPSSPPTTSSASSGTISALGGGDMS